MSALMMGHLSTVLYKYNMLPSKTLYVRSFYKGDWEGGGGMNGYYRPLVSVLVLDPWIMALSWLLIPDLIFSARSALWVYFIHGPSKGLL